MQSKKDFIIDVIYYSLIFVIVYLAIKYLFGVLFPFVLGFLIAFSLKPLIRWIVKKTKLNNKFVSLLILIFFYALIGMALFFIIARGANYLSSLFSQLPYIYTHEIQPVIESFTTWISQIFVGIDPSVVSLMEQFESNILDSLMKFFTSLSTNSISFLTSLITKVPAFFLAFFFSIISSFFITIDYDKITSFLNAQFTGRGEKLFMGIRNNGLSVILNFIKAYAIIISVTFIEASVGLSLLGYSNAIGISIIIAVVDILPVLGTGTIIIPWTIIEAVNGNYGSALGLALLYIVITVIRQVIEPKIVGDKIGLYPLITLISMYIGTMYFGIIGLFLVPIGVTIAVKLQEDGIINFYKSPKEDLVIEENENV